MNNDEQNLDAPTNRWSQWFRWAMWLGILQDVVLGIPAVFWPTEVLSLLGQKVPAEPIWVSFAAVTLLVLATMYVPVAINPYRNPVMSWLAVLARPPGIVFFFWLYPHVYPLFGWIDTGLTALQLPLLLLTLYAPRQPDPRLAARRLADSWKAQPAGEYSGTTFQHVKQIVWSDPYDTLPYHFGFGPLKPVQFFNHSSRNLSDRRDLLPYFDKLIHANGISFTGTWKITEPSLYTGYFAQGREGLLLVRASVAGLFLKAGTFRAFGMGGKIFPTLDPDEWVYPANFVAVSHLSGIRRKHVIDIAMTNQPSVGLDPTPNVVNRIIFRLMDTRPGLRQLHPISTLGMRPGERIVTPHLMMLRIAEGSPRVFRKDFRDELRLENYPDRRLEYDILVRDRFETEWTRIGTIELTDYTISESGDKRLHFWIPRDRPD
jgi:hypothetical protein